jgi:hypothetical protein
MRHHGNAGPAKVKATSNNALERPRTVGGLPVLAMDCVLAGAELAPWQAAQRNR